MHRKFYLTIIFAIFAFVAADAVVIRSHKLTRSEGLTSVYIRDIEQDETGFLWFGTPEGLYRYDGYNVTQILPRTEEEKKIFPDMRIQLMTISEGHLLLILVRGDILVVYDTRKCRFVSVGKDKDKKYREKLNENVQQTNIEFGRLKKLVHEYTDDNPQITLSPYIKALYKDKQGNIYVSEENRGLTIFSPLRGLAHYLYNGTTDMVHDNVIRTLYNDPDGTFCFIPQYDEVVSVVWDKEGHKWCGTRNNGVIVDGKAYMHSDSDPRSIGKGKVSCVCVDKKGRVWITLFNSGLYLAHPDGKGGYWFEKMKTDLNQPRQIMVDHHNQLWVCSSSGTLLFDSDRHTGKFIMVGTDNVRIDETHQAFEDSHHNVWIATIGFGIGLLDNSRKGAPKLKSVFTTDSGLSENRVQSVTEDKYGNIWAGTNYGLSMYSPRLKQWLRFYPGDTELSMMFSEASVCHLKDGRIAFGTNHGVAVIDPSVGEKFVTKGMKIDGKDGFKLALTDIDINGIDIEEISGQCGVEGQLSDLKELQLNHDQNCIDFFVSDFDYRSGEHTTYQFWLKGCDKGWCDPQTSNHRLYDNLEPGTYTLLVKAHTENGIELAHQVQLKVVIKQVWYLTWWAFLIYICAIAVIGYGYWQHVKEKQQLKNRIKVESELTKYKTIFFTNISHEFRTPLTIISGAMEAIWQSDRMPGELKSSVVSMKRSTDRLMRLINQLMDFSRIHEGKLKLRVQETDAVAFARDIYETFNIMAQQKNIDLSFHTTERSIMMPLDRNFLDKILYNLMGNAFKYTPSGGSVMLSIETSKAEAQPQLVIKVTDTGVGVPKDKQQALFSQFDQSTFISDSVGLGLHLTKTLVSAHHGTIAYTDNKALMGESSTGSIFTVTLPMADEAYSEGERMQTSAIAVKSGSDDASAIPTDYKEVTATPFNEQKNVLIVEDDVDVQAFLKNVLGNHFTLFTAGNGQEGLDVLMNNEIHLVVTDIMMPVMSGMEMVRKMRAKAQFSNLPVIMLTAIDSEEKQIKAYNIGVDAFMQKPFSPQILIAKVIQMLQKATQAPAPTQGQGNDTEDSSQNDANTSNPRHTSGGGMAPTLIIDSQDKRYRDQFEHWLEQHLSDKDLGVDKFAEAMGMGRTAFFKRVKDITGKSPNEYIRQRRMERAMKLLADDSLSIQQIADKVGIDDAYYFSKIFKSVYGMSPSQYRKTGGTPSAS